MAEVIGVTFGLASLALQLGESALRLKMLYKGYKDAPETIADTAFEMETFQMLLSDVENEIMSSSGADPALLDRCLQMCRRVCNRIDSLINTLDEVMRRSSRWGRVRTVTSEKQISQLCTDIHRAVEILHFSYTLYADSRRRQESQSRHDPLSQQLAVSSKTVLQKTPGDAAMSRDPYLEKCSACKPAFRPLAEARKMKASAGYKRRSRYVVSIHPWFASWSWSFALQRTRTGWSLDMSISHLVPDDAIIFSVVERGDLTTVKKMFQRGLAAPNVYRNISPINKCHKQTLLEVAAHNSHTELSKYLLSFDEMNCQQHLVLNSSWLYAWRWKELDGRSETIARLMLANADVSVAHVADQPSKCLWILLSPAFPSLLRDALTDMSGFLPAVFASELDDVSSQGSSLAPLGILRMIDVSMIDRRAAALESRHGRTVMHLVAMAFHGIDPDGLWAIRYDWHGDLLHLADIVRCLLDFGADPCKKDVNGFTPLQIAISDSRVPSRKLVSWTQMLQSAGIDLTTYGSHEAQHWTAMRPGPTLSNTWLASFGLVGLYYSSDASEWDILVEDFAYAELYTHLPPAGSLALDDSTRQLPMTINWRPDEEDVPDEHWVLKEQVEKWSGSRVRLRTSWQLAKDQATFDRAKTQK